MNEEELLELANDLLQISNCCNEINAKNLSHRIRNIQQGLISKAEYIQLKVKKQ